MRRAGLKADLSQYTERQIEAEISRLQDELQQRRRVVEQERLKNTKCCYCGVPMDSDSSCLRNPFSEFHVG
jgi:hypothetical protein